MDGLTISIRDIKFSQLNGECLRLVAKFSRALKAEQGESLKLQDPNILVKISDKAHVTNSQNLKQIYIDLKEAMTRSVRESMEKSTSDRAVK